MAPRWVKQALRYGVEDGRVASYEVVAAPERLRLLRLLRLRLAVLAAPEAGFSPPPTP